MDGILEAKKAALEKKMRKMPLEGVAARAAKKRPPSFKKAITDSNDIKIICEYKRASPSGALPNRPLEETVKAFERGGAAAVSVVTEESIFKGSLGLLEKAAETTSLPVLRKDFITTEYELLEAKAAGAGAVLLIAGVCPDLAGFVSACKKIGVAALVETTKAGEVGDALDAGAEIVGINNRRFSDLSIDLRRTRELCGLVPKKVVLVSESGFKDGGRVKALSECARVPDAVLVGTAVMKADEIGKKVRELVKAGKGLKR